MHRLGRPTLLVATLLAVLTAGCGFLPVTPARTDQAYERKAVSTLDTVRGAVEATIVLGQATGRHDLPNAYQSVLVGESESEASGAEGTFSSIQPPSRHEDAVREQVLAVVGDAVDLLSTVRIEVRRGDDGVVHHLGELRRASSALLALSTARDRYTG